MRTILKQTQSFISEQNINVEIHLLGRSVWWTFFSPFHGEGNHLLLQDLMRSCVTLHAKNLTCASQSQGHVNISLDKFGSPT